MGEFVAFTMRIHGTPTRVDSPYCATLGAALAQAAHLVWADPDAAADQFEFYDEERRTLLRCTGLDLQQFQALVEKRYVAPWSGGMGADSAP
jgi:hypothetical protein